MKNDNIISEKVNQLIEFEDLPHRATIKPLSRFDGLYPENEEEYQAYCDFIHWGCVIREHTQLLSLPLMEKKDDFIMDDHSIFADHDSSFNTLDYKRLHPRKFNKYQYKLRKIFERLSDLAQTYSCLSCNEGKKNIEKRFDTIVANEFRDQFNVLLDTLSNYPKIINRKKLIKRMTTLVNHIEKCKDIWHKHAKGV